ncbi:hypothetical protein HORIV_29710 [Vreelandella olivaria]|uniref:Glycosyltransferase 2-like domain-containing protein n=1 Tax=Vreelandella olivaria TaxID=390919 RepID=A0ABM7GIQ9_9GAMM|nr:hypothetical protein HORIV_29710 [Halomonas olivaria]
MWGIYFYVHWERKQPWPDTFTWDETAPKVTVLLPCYNEEANVEETIHHLFKQNYPYMDVIAVNDGSKDDTASRLDTLALEYPALQVLHQTNQGKASALNNG